MDLLNLNKIDPHDSVLFLNKADWEEIQDVLRDCYHYFRAQREREAVLAGVQPTAHPTEEKLDVLMTKMNNVVWHMGTF